MSTPSNITPPKYFQTTGYRCHTLFDSFFIYDGAYIIPLPLMKTKSTRWNVKVDNKDKDCLAFEKAHLLSPSIAERSNKTRTKYRIKKDDWWMTEVVQAMNYNRSRIQYQNTASMKTGKKANLCAGKSNCTYILSCSFSKKGNRHGHQKNPNPSLLRGPEF